MKAGFPRESRLLKPAQYSVVFQQPIKSTDNCFTVLGRPTKNALPRLGLAVSKKNTRLAVNRNRIKRVIRESFRTHRDVIGSMDCVVMNRKGSEILSNQELFDSLSRHWQRLQRKAADTNQ